MGQKAALDKVPYSKYLELEERYRKIFKDGDDKKPPPNSSSYTDRFLDRVHLQILQERHRHHCHLRHLHRLLTQVEEMAVKDHLTIFLRHHLRCPLTIDQKEKSIFLLLPGC